MTDYDIVVQAALHTYVGKGTDLISAHLLKVQTADELAELGKGAVLALKRHFMFQYKYDCPETTRTLRRAGLSYDEALTSLNAMIRKAMAHPTIPIDRSVLHFIPEDVFDTRPATDSFVYDVRFRDWRGARFISMRETGDAANPDVVFRFEDSGDTVIHPLRSPCIILLDEYREMLVMTPEFRQHWLELSAPVPADIKAGLAARIAEL